MTESSSAGPAVRVTDVPERHRYEAYVTGVADFAVASYDLRGDVIVFTHTKVPPPLAGRGVGTALARTALDDARRRGLRVVPRCPFIAAFVRRHSEYQDLVSQA